MIRVSNFWWKVFPEYGDYSSKTRAIRGSGRHESPKMGTSKVIWYVDFVVWTIGVKYKSPNRICILKGYCRISTVGVFA